MNDIQILNTLYGEGVWEITKAMTAEQKQKRDKRITQTLAAGNAVSAVAGPAALYSAVRSARNNTGGIPRDVATGIGTKLKASPSPRLRKVGEAVMKPVDALNKVKPGAKVPKRLKIAAGAAGATMVGLQAINASVDAASAKVLSNQAKKKDKVNKSEGGLPPHTEVKLKMLRKGTDGAFYTLKKIPVENIKAVKKTPVHKSDDLIRRVAALYAQVEEVSKSADVDMAIRGEVCKMNTEKKQVFGWASVIELDGKPVVDLQDDVMTIETIEKAAYKYVHGSRKGGHQHQREGDEPLHVSDMIESFVLTPEKKEAMGLPDTTPTGWWVGFKVNDEQTWQDYKSGKLKDFSIHGSGRRVELDVN